MNKTSLLTTDKAPKGFTLLEVIIVVTIIAFIAGMVLPRINNRNTEIKAAVRKLSVLCRELRSKAKLQNATYRLVIQIPASDKESHSFWVEKSAGEIINNYDAKNPPKLPQKNSGDTEDKSAEKDEAAEPELFSPDTKTLKHPEELPGELQFESIEIASVENPIDSGISYIHFMPSGFADEAVIHLKNGDKIKWSLAINPLTGHVDVIDEFRSLEDLRAK